MDLTQKLNLSLFDLTNLIEEKGYEALPFKVNDGCKIVLFKNDKLLRMGKNVYPTYQDGLKDVYQKIYDNIFV